MENLDARRKKPRREKQKGRVTQLSKKKSQLKRIKALEDQVTGLTTTINQQMGLIYRNERAFADMVYTNGVRIAVLKQIIQEKLGVDDVAYEALIDQEIAARKAEEEAARKRALEEAQKKTAMEKAKELGMKVAKDYEHTVEDVEFGGDFGDQDEVAEEAADQDQPSEDSDGGGSYDGRGSLNPT